MTILEKNIIAAALDSENYPESAALLTSGITAKHFSDQYGRTIFTLLQRIVNRGHIVDNVTLSNEAEHVPVEERQIVKNLIDEIAVTFAPGSMLPQYMEQLREEYRQRHVADALRKALNAISNNEDYEEYLADAFCTTTQSTEQYIHDMDYIMPAVIDDLCNDVTGIKTGFTMLDKYTNGFAAGDLVIIGAYTGMGKSAFAVNMAANMARMGNNILFFTAEMSGTEVSTRMLCAEAEINKDQLRYCSSHPDTAVTMEVLTHATTIADKIASWGITICDKSGITITELESICMMQKTTKKIDCIFVDYLQIIESDRRHNQRSDEVAYLSRRLKRLAQRMECPVIAMVQMNRELAQSYDHVPKLHQIRESAAIEQDANTVLLLHREKAFAPMDVNVPTNEAELYIAKQRNGIGAGRIVLDYAPQITRFYDAGKMPSKFKK